MSVWNHVHMTCTLMTAPVLIVLMGALGAQDQVTLIVSSVTLPSAMSLTESQDVSF